MAKAIETGMPEDAHRGGGRPHPGPHRLRRQTAVGVNKYTRRERREAIAVLKVDNAAVRDAQIAKLARSCAPSATRRPPMPRWRSSPGPPATPARTDADRNLLELAIDAARAKATVGEISDALEKVYGRYTRQHPYDLGRVLSESGVDRGRHQGARAGRGVREGRGTPAAHPGRQDGPGRPRPRPEGDLDGVRRPRLRPSTSVRCSRPRRKRRARPSRTTSTWSVSPPSPPVT